MRAPAVAAQVASIFVIPSLAREMQWPLNWESFLLFWALNLSRCPPKFYSWIKEYWLLGDFILFVLNKTDNDVIFNERTQELLHLLFYKIALWYFDLLPVGFHNSLLIFPKKMIVDQGWSSQQFLVKLSRAKVARSLICWSRAEPESSSLILLEPSWAQKLKFDIDRAKP